jgi:putative transposase
MIEAFWRSLRHQWLYLHSLDSVVALERLVSFYVNQHNEVMPHSSFAGQTPNDSYFGQGAAVIDDLATARAAARRTRVEENRRESCHACRPPGNDQSVSDSVAVANATPG